MDALLDGVNVAHEDLAIYSIADFVWAVNGWIALHVRSLMEPLT